MADPTPSQAETTSTIIVDTKDDQQFWKEEEEKILEEWADKAQCFEWMHQKIIIFIRKWKLHYSCNYYFKHSLVRRISHRIASQKSMLVCLL